MDARSKVLILSLSLSQGISRPQHLDRLLHPLPEVLNRSQQHAEGGLVHPEALPFFFQLLALGLCHRAQHRQHLRGGGARGRVLAAWVGWMRSEDREEERKRKRRPEA